MPELTPSNREAARRIGISETALRNSDWIPANAVEATSSGAPHFQAANILHGKMDAGTFLKDLDRNLLMPGLV